MVTFVPVVADVSHYNAITKDGWEQAKDAGLLGVICKATQGTHYADPKYPGYRKGAEDAGLLWGAYHFNSGNNPKSQVDWFLHAISPDDDFEIFNSTLMALDYEANPKSDMSINQAVQFLRYLEEQVGRKGVIYSGNKLKETIGKLNDEDAEYICSHKLWIAQYGPRVTLPKGFDKWWLHQFTGDGHGPLPHWIDGITCPGNKGIDLNRYYSKDTSKLADEWVS